MKTSPNLANLALGISFALAASFSLNACGDDDDPGDKSSGGRNSTGGEPMGGSSGKGMIAGASGGGAAGTAGTAPISGGAGEGGDAGANSAAGAAAFDAQTPPTEAGAVEAWLDEEFYKDWACEPEPTKKTDGAGAIHVHGAATRVCTNILLAASNESDAGEFPVGSASVKEVYDEGGDLEVRVLSVKARTESDSGNGWFWYESPSLSGFGLTACTGCHGAAGSDVDHPGEGDYVYFKVRDEAELPPIDGNAMQAWIDGGYYKEWQCEDDPNTKNDGAAAIHVHGKTRVCTNTSLARASAGGQFPAGVASVKELYSGDTISGYDVYLKVFADSADGDGWYWYGDGNQTSGFGLAGCVGCHSAAGTDTDHPGAGDFVYFKN